MIAYFKCNKIKDARQERLARKLGKKAWEGLFMQDIRVCTYDGPGAKPVIRTVPWPKIGKKAALIKVGACGVCGTDLHILKGHWPKPLPWPFTLGHGLGGDLGDCGNGVKDDLVYEELK